MFIYKLTFPNNKSYIGMVFKKGKTLYQRFLQHLKGSRSKNKKHTKLHYAIKKYGSQNIKYEILQDKIINKKYLCQRQNFYILKYDTYISKQIGFGGYNMTLGGEGNLRYGYKRSSQTKIKQSERRKKYFKQHPERIQKIRKQKSGIILTDQQRKIIGENSKKRWDNNPQRKIQMSQRFKKYQKDHNYQSRKKTQRQKDKQSQISKQRYFNPEERQKLRQRQTKFYEQNPHLKQEVSIKYSGRGNPFFGKKHPQQTILKIKFTKSLNRLNKQCLSRLESINFMLR